jgi:fatty-acyl-CoA synthase
VLLAHDAVADVAVVGEPSDEWGETVVAVVVVVEGQTVTDTELLEHAARELAPYKQPRHVRFVAELPRNALGKVLRHQL